MHEVALALSVQILLCRRSVGDETALHSVCCGALQRELNMGLLVAVWLLDGEKERGNNM